MYEMVCPRQRMAHGSYVAEPVGMPHEHADVL